jgi:hypothetical protein
MPLNPKGETVELVDAKCGNLVAAPETGPHHVNEKTGLCNHGVSYR